MRGMQSAFSIQTERMFAMTIRSNGTFWGEPGMSDEPIVGEPDWSDSREPPRRRVDLGDLLDIDWPETGLQTSVRLSTRPKDALGEDDVVELTVDFVTLSLTPLEFIQLASFLRMSVDGMLELHPGLQRAVVRAFDIKD